APPDTGRLQPTRRGAYRLQVRAPAPHLTSSSRGIQRSGFAQPGYQFLPAFNPFFCSKYSDPTWVRSMRMIVELHGTSLQDAIGHFLYVTNSSSNAFASFRSRVSKPSVNHPYTGASSSRACSTLSWSRQRQARLVEARSSSSLALCLRLISIDCRRC